MAYFCGEGGGEEGEGHEGEAEPFGGVGEMGVFLVGGEEEEAGHVHYPLQLWGEEGVLMRVWDVAYGCGGANDCYTGGF